MGEVPGDKEDLAGHTFVGPAGKVLDDVVDDVGLDRTKIYLTNAGKHFKFESAVARSASTRRRTEEQAVRSQWWMAELDAVKPKVLGLAGSGRGKRCSGRKHAA